VVPGPGVIYIVTRSLGQGRRAGLVSVLGVEGGNLVHVAAASLGLSALIASSAEAFTVVKYAGAAYLVYLGTRTLLARSADPAEQLREAPANTPAHAVRQGLLTEALNPKTALFFLTFLPQFCQPEHGALALQLIVLGAISVALNTLVDVVVAHGAGRISDRLRERPRLWRRQQIATGSLLLGLGAVAATGHKSA
jgi:threonine/homoserine/homoserine lactone efflux protein